MQLQNKFKIRCSAIGQIMANPRTKSETLSKTCITYVHEWIKSQPEFYDRQINFNSKYTLKGLLLEDESINFASKYYGWGSVTKNEESKENEYLSGTADIILQNSVEDIKNSWSQKSFPLFDTEIPIDGYGWQLQGYMELYDKPSAGLVYTLMDAPDFMVDKEANFKRIELGLEEVDYEMWQEIKDSMTYSNLRDEIRIKRYFVDRDKDLMQSVYERVELIREYIGNL